VRARVRSAAKSKLADVEAKIGDLEAIRRKLHELAGACPNDGPADACPILDALDEEEQRHG
jgi:hypothetical protein